MSYSAHVKIGLFEFFVISPGCPGEVASRPTGLSGPWLSTAKPIRRPPSKYPWAELPNGLLTSRHRYQTRENSACSQTSWPFLFQDSPHCSPGRTASLAAGSGGLVCLLLHRLPPRRAAPRLGPNRSGEIPRLEPASALRILDLTPCHNCVCKFFLWVCSWSFHFVNGASHRGKF